MSFVRLSSQRNGVFGRLSSGKAGLTSANGALSGPVRFQPCGDEKSGLRWSGKALSGSSAQMTVMPE